MGEEGRPRVITNKAMLGSGPCQVSNHTGGSYKIATPVVLCSGHCQRQRGGYKLATPVVLCSGHLKCHRCGYKIAIPVMLSHYFTSYAAGDTRGGADEPIEIESSSDEEVCIYLTSRKLFLMLLTIIKQNMETWPKRKIWCIKCWPLLYLI